MKTKNNKGFSLIELLVVIAIISLLSALSIAAVNYARERARNAKALSDIANLYNAITLLSNDTEQWPGHQAVNTVSAAANNEICGEDEEGNDCNFGLSDEQSGLTSNDSGTPYANWNGPYMPTLINDPWGREYFFDTDYSVDFESNPCACTNTGCHDVVVIGSYGPDQNGAPTGGNPGAYGCDDIIRIIFN